MIKTTLLSMATLAGMLTLALPSRTIEAPTTLADEDRLEDLRQFYEQQFGLEILELEVHEPPRKKLVERVAQVTASDFRVLDQAGFFRAIAGGEAAWVCDLPATPERERLLLCTADDGRFMRGAAIDAGDENIEWRRLFVTIAKRDALSIETARSHAQLAARQEEAAAGDSDEDRLTTALVKQRTDMMRILEQFMSMAGRLQGGEEVSGELDALTDRFEAFADHASPLANVLGDRTEDYADFADALAGLMSDAARTENPMPLLRDAQSTCNSCHQLELDGDDSGLQNHVMSLRSDLGVGNDYFKVGFDLSRTGEDLELEQVRATAVRSGLLLISALEE